MADNCDPTAEAEVVGSEPTVVATVKGILDDALELMRQQIALLKAEVRADVTNFVAAAIPLVASAAPLLLGGLMLCFAFVHWLHWVTLPSGTATDPAAIPLWGCYAIVSATFGLTGTILLGMGIFRLRRVHAVPEQSVKALEENIQWLMNKNPK
jgi:hypothetical protein